MSSLPPEVLSMVEFEPVEDIALYLLRDTFQLAPVDIKVQSLIEKGQQFPAILIRRTPDWGWPAGDDRFLDSGNLTVHTYADGLEADADCARLQEAVRVVLRDSVNKVVPGLGYLTYVRRLQTPRRVSDWVTATGPVQYADLPSGISRYESIYRLAIRAPLT